LAGGLAVREAKAGFVGAYSLDQFTLNNSAFANGYASTPDPSTLIFTGPNDGSGLDGAADLTVRAYATGVVQFDFLYLADDLPEYDFAGYLSSADFHMLADSTGTAGTILLDVLAGQTFGFRIGTIDNLGEPAVLTITNFSAPVPEPGGLQLGLIATGALGAYMLLRYRRLRELRLWIAGVAAIGIAGPLSAQPVYYSASNATGKMVLTRVVNLRQQALVQPFQMRALRTAPAEKLPAVAPTRLRPPMKAGLLAKMAAPATPTAPARSLTIVPPSSAWGFNALSHFDQRLANYGNQFSIEPPSPSIAAANGYVLEGVNNAVQVYNISGAPVLPIVVSTNQLFGLPPVIDRATDVYGPYLTDMRVYFDPGISRWFVLQRSQDNDQFGRPLYSSHLYLAVSKTTDPAGDYNIYQMETTNLGRLGCPCVADYPQIGSDQYGFHIAWNEFTSNSLSFVDAGILTLSKAALFSGAAQPTASWFQLPFTTGFEFALQPATTPPGASSFLASGGLEYFVSTSASYAFGNQVALWAMYNTSSLATANPNPVLTRVFTPILDYSFPDVATQRSGPTPYGSSLNPPSPLEFLDGGDQRLLSLSYASGRLFLSLQTAVRDENGRWVVGAAYAVLSPTFRGGVLAATVLNQGYLLVNNNHLLRPAIAVNAQGRGAIAATLVGPDWHPSAAFIPFETFLTPATVQVVCPGTLPEDGFTGYPDGGFPGLARWGDYNGAVADADGSIWMVVQYIGTYPRTEYANWNTYVMRRQ
jgi:hypothetical protein